VDAKTITLVQESWAKVEPISMTAADLFYAKLFELDPGLEPLFKGDMMEQKGKLMQMIGTAVKMLNRLDELVPVVVKLGERHVEYGVVAKDYDTVGAALLDTLSKGLGDEFTPEVEQAWTEVYGVLAETMLSADSTPA
jgi:hemoglobin-like flavoprotein